MTKIETAHEARAMFLVNDADAIEEAANEWALTAYQGAEVNSGVDANGNIWLAPDVMLNDGELVAFANWAKATWN